MQTPTRAEPGSINPLDDATRAWINDHDLFRYDSAAIKRGPIAERNFVVSGAQLRQHVSDRHALEPWIRLHLPTFHVSEKFQRVAPAKHRRHAGKNKILSLLHFRVSAIIAAVLHRCP